MASGGTDGPMGELRPRNISLGIGTYDGAPFFVSLGAGVIWGKTGGAADGAILVFDLT
jgi:hypothetical protein